MENLWNENTRGLEPYVPGEQPKDGTFIKLNTNENPYPPSPSVLRNMREADYEKLRLYPDPEAGLLRSAAAEVMGLDKEEVFAGNGSDEILAMCFMAFFDDKRQVLMPEISYSFYEVYAKIFGIKVKKVPLREDLSIDLEDYFEPNGGVVIANPNAPTGIALTRSEIEEILKKNTESVVIVDEAYVDFGAESSISLIKDYKNLLVVQTLSKSYSLAGLRTGFAYGNKSLIEGLNRVKNSFNSYTLDRLALELSLAAIRDRKYFEESCTKVANTRKWVIDSFRNLGFAVTDSLANFIFVRHPKYRAAELQLKLRQRGILVRHFKTEKIENYLRITIGTDDDMKKLVECVKEVIF